MPPNYEHNSLDYLAYGNDYGTSPDNHGPTGFPWVMYNIQTFVIFPMILILNLILLIKIFGNQKLRSEPWRWLVAHTSFCYMLIIFIAYNQYASSVYLKPSLMTTPLCPILAAMSVISGNMLVVSITLLAIERFHALRLGRENEGGMGTKAVILSVVLFWLLLITVYVVLLIIVPLIVIGETNVIYYELVPGIESCHININGYREIVNGLLFAWALVSSVVAITGAAVYKNRKTTTDAMKQSIVAPTLAFCCFTIFLMLIPDFFFIFETFIYLGENGSALISIIWLMNGIAFPITWLVTWSCNGDISWNWKNDAEHQRLLVSS